MESERYGGLSHVVIRTVAPMPAGFDTAGSGGVAMPPCTARRRGNPTEPPRVGENRPAVQPPR
eukprot:scaffold121295_cov59-Phaeocystis_antarctica.AAC.6